MEFNEKIIAAVYEPYWGLQTGVFCTLKPLVDMGLNAVDISEFYNRGRIWWKLRPGDENYAVVGRLIALEVEASVSFDKMDPNKDKYQVAPGRVWGAEQYIVEIVSIDPSISQTSLIETGVLTCDHPVHSVLFCKSGGYIIGPFTCGSLTMDETNQSIEVSINPGWGTQELRRVEWGRFKEIVQPYEIDLQVFTEEHERNSKLVKYSFFKRERLYAFFEENIGEVIDTRSDKSVVSEVAKDIGWSRKDKKIIQELVEVINRPGMDSDRIQKNKDRIFKIVNKIDQYQDIIGELIESLMNDKNIQLKLDEKVEEKSLLYIKEHKKELERKIESEVYEKQNELNILKQKYDSLNELIESRKKERMREVEVELEQKKKQFEEELKHREAELEKREADLNRFQDILDKFEQNKEEIINNLVIFMPIFERLGTLGCTAHEPVNMIGDHPPAVRETGGTDIIDRIAYTPLIKSDAEISEDDFIERWIRCVEAFGYIFDTEDLLNFHICTKSEDLNIIAGPTGIGKSSLPRLYAHALHGNAGGHPRFLMVSVKPGWLDSQDLIGHFNALEGRFQPSGSGFFHFLISAVIETRSSESGIFLCCLDEMNLSYLEHYFADFLSSLQLPPGDRILRLFPENLSDGSDPYRDYSKILLPRTLKFCGTVNIDETTKFFTPKVIDRVHIIEISSPRLSELSSWGQAYYAPLDTDSPVTEDTYRSWTKDPGVSKDFALSVLSRFEDHLSLNISPRTHISVCRYISNAQGVLESDEKAMDYAIFQKILPKLRGHTPEFREKLKRFQDICDRNGYYKSSERLYRMANANIAMDFFNYALE